MVRFLPSDRISPDQHSPLQKAHPKANVDVRVDELLKLALTVSDGVVKFSTATNLRVGLKIRREP